MLDALPGVVLFPNWNDKVTASDRLRELAVMAEKHPDRFQKLFVGWIGVDEGRAFNNERSLNMETSELLGWLEIWKHQIIKRTVKEC